MTRDGIKGLTFHPCRPFRPFQEEESSPRHRQRSIPTWSTAKRHLMHRRERFGPVNRISWVHAFNPRKRTYDLQGIQDTLFDHVTVLSHTGIVAHVELVSVLFQQGTDDDGSFLAGVFDDRSCGTGNGGLDDGYAELLVKVGYFEVVEDEGCFLGGG